MSNFNLINVDGKPLEKLLDVISKGVGVLYKPKEIRRNADAKAYEVKVIAKAETNAKIDSAELDQQYIEDCQVCCKPIVFNVVVDFNGDLSVSVHDENDAY